MSANQERLVNLFLRCAYKSETFFPCFLKAYAQARARNESAAADAVGIVSMKAGMALGPKITPMVEGEEEEEEPDFVLVLPQASDAHADADASRAAKRVRREAPGVLATLDAGTFDVLVDDVQRVIVAHLAEWAALGDTVAELAIIMFARTSKGAHAMLLAAEATHPHSHFFKHFRAVHTLHRERDTWWNEHLLAAAADAGSITLIEFVYKTLPKQTQYAGHTMNWRPSMRYALEELVMHMSRHGHAAAARQLIELHPAPHQSTRWTIELHDNVSAWALIAMLETGQGGSLADFKAQMDIHGPLVFRFLTHTPFVFDAIHPAFIKALGMHMIAPYARERWAAVSLNLHRMVDWRVFEENTHAIPWATNTWDDHAWAQWLQIFINTAQTHRYRFTGDSFLSLRHVLSAASIPNGTIVVVYSAVVQALVRVFDYDARNAEEAALADAYSPAPHDVSFFQAQWKWLLEWYPGHGTLVTRPFPLQPWAEVARLQWVLFQRYRYAAPLLEQLPAFEITDMGAITDIILATTTMLSVDLPVYEKHFIQDADGAAFMESTLRLLISHHMSRELLEDGGALFAACQSGSTNRVFVDWCLAETLRRAAVRRADLAESLRETMDDADLIAIVWGGPMDNIYYTNRRATYNYYIQLLAAT